MRYLYYNPFFEKEWKSHFSTKSGMQYLAASDLALVNLIKPDEIIIESMGQSVSGKMGYNPYISGGKTTSFNEPLGIDYEIVMGIGGFGEYLEQSKLPKLDDGDEFVFISMYHCFHHLYQARGVLEHFDRNKIKVEFFSEEFCMDFSTTGGGTGDAFIQGQMIINLDNYVNDYSKREVEKTKKNLNRRIEKQKKYASNNDKT